jgi:hypothetical protein
MEQPVMTWICSYRRLFVDTQPVAVVWQIIKIGVNTYKTIKKMTQNMKGFAEVTLLYILQICSGVNTGLPQLINQPSDQLMVALFRQFELREKIPIKPGNRVLLPDLDVVIYNQGGELKKSANLVTAL